MYRMSIYRMLTKEVTEVRELKVVKRKRIKWFVAQIPWFRFQAFKPLPGTNKAAN